MSGIPLRDFIVTVSRAAEKLFYKNGEVRPMWYFVDGKGEHHVVPAPPTHDKDLAAATMRALFELIGATRCLFIDEAWIAEASDKAGGDRIQEAASTTGLEHFPGRKEVVWFFAEDQDEGFMCGRRTIERPPNGRAKLGALIIDDRGEWSGRLAGMLPQPPKARTQ